MTFVSVSLCSFAEASKPFRKGIVEEAFVYESADFPSCHSATIVETPEGLVTAFFGGTQ